MIAVLLAATLVAPCRLQVAFDFSTDPDIGPCRRYGKLTDTVERIGITHRPAVGVLVGKALAALAPSDARFGVTDVNE